jgi:hypothetical protein
LYDIYDPHHLGVFKRGVECTIRDGFASMMWTSPIETCPGHLVWPNPLALIDEEFSQFAACCFGKALPMPDLFGHPVIETPVDFYRKNVCLDDIAAKVKGELEQLDINVGVALVKGNQTTLARRPDGTVESSRNHVYIVLESEVDEAILGRIQRTVSHHLKLLLDRVRNSKPAGNRRVR